MLKWNRLVTASMLTALIAAPLGADEPEQTAPATQPSAKQVPAPVKTGKERLSSKASDEQRVDNCKVPPELRGTTPRPDSCDTKIPTH